MLDAGRGVFHFQVGEGVGAALVAQEQRIALRVVPRALGALQNFHHPSVAVLASAGGNALRNDGAPGVLADVNHLRARIRLLVVVRNGHGIELAHRVFTLEDAARILPGNGRARLDLGPGNFGVDAEALAALGDEVVDPALPFLVPRVPVLDGRVFDLGVVESDQLHNRRVQLVAVAHGRGATFEVAHVRAFVRDNQRALELARVLGVDPEIRRELHRTPDALRDVTEGTVSEHRRVQRGKEVVRVRDHRAQPFPDQVGVLAHRLGERAEDDAELGQFSLERGRHRDAVKDGVNGHPGQQLLLLERDTELFVSLQNFGIDVIEAFDRRLLRLRSRVVSNRLIVNGRVMDVGPGRLLHREPMAVRLQPPFQQPIGFVLLGGNMADDVFI